MDDSEGDCDDEQLKEAMKCRCCIASQRSGRQIRGKREGRHMTVDRQDSRRELQVCRVRSRHLYCGRNQRVHVAYSRHTEGASYAQTYFTGQHCIDNLSEHAARIILGHKRAHSIGNPDGPVVGRSVTTKWWRHSSVLKWWATSYRLSWAPKRWKRILAFTITFELVS